MSRSPGRAQSLASNFGRYPARGFGGLVAGRRAVREDGGKGIAVFEESDLEDLAGGFDRFVTAVIVNGPGDDGSWAVAADSVFEFPPFAPVEFSVLCDGITYEEGIGGVGEVGGGGEVSAVEAGVCEGFSPEGV